MIAGTNQFVHSPDCKITTQNQPTEVKGQPVGGGQIVTQIVAFGRAICNYTPSEEEKDFLHLKVSVFNPFHASAAPSPAYVLWQQMFERKI